MPHKSFRQESRSDYGVTASENYNLTNEQLQLGALLRIADASEKMATNYTDLQNRMDWYKRQYENAVRRSEKLQRQVNAYKGIVKKLKKKS